MFVYDTFHSFTTKGENFMRVAILEPEPGVKGPTRFAFNLRQGFEELGHECQVVSFTKSGKTRKSWGTAQPGGRWWGDAPDVVVKTRDLVAVLDTYDLVVLPEIRVLAHDKTALKEGENVLPDYVDALRKTKTRWTTALHGTPYIQKEIPFVGALLESPSRAAAFVTTRDNPEGDANDYFASIKWVRTRLPYLSRYKIEDEIPTGNVVGVTGRFVYNKGQPLAAVVGAFLPEDVRMELWGACSIGLGPSPTYLVYEQLKEHFGATGKRHAVLKAENMGKPGFDEDGNVITPYHWDLKVPNGPEISYLGNYHDPVVVNSRFRVHLNLTAGNFSSGHCEFTTMEALEAGAMCVTPKHLSDPEFKMNIIDYYDRSPTHAKLVFPEGIELAKRIAESVKESLAIPDAERLEIARYNRALLREMNSPAKTAQAMIDSAFS
jgi:hypothetical protein